MKLVLAASAIFVNLLQCGAPTPVPSASLNANTSTNTNGARRFAEIWRTEREAAHAAIEAKDYAAYRAHMQELYDRSGSVRILEEIARAEARLGHRAEAIATLGRIAGMGVAAEIDGVAAFAPLEHDAALEPIRATFRANRSAITGAQPFAALPSEELIAEDLTYDAALRTFFVTSIRHRKIVAIDAGGHARNFAESPADLGGMAGIALSGDVLWTTTAWFPHVLGTKPAGATGTAILAVDRRTGARRDRIDLPASTDQHAPALTDLAVSSDGTLFVSDSQEGDIYVRKPGARTLERLVPHGELLSPQTPALSADGRRVLVPDYVRGIAAIDLTSHALTWLARADTVTLTGIDGLYTYGDALIAVQNGVEPPRIVRFVLDAAATRVVRADVLARAAPGFGEPTHGVIVDGMFYFIANAGWDRFDDDGHLKQGAPPDAPAIWSLPLPK